MIASLVLAVVACGAFLFLVMRAARSIVREHDWLPAELQGGELLFSERLFFGRAPIFLVARIDRAYLVKGQLYLVELKKRMSSKVFETDVIELSAQRAAVQASTAYQVSRTGIVVIENAATGRRTVRKVELLDDDWVAELLRRRQAVLDGHAYPRETKTEGRCAACEYRSECKGQAGARVYPLIRSPATRAAPPRSDK